VKKELRM